MRKISIIHEPRPVLCFLTGLLFCIFTAGVHADGLAGEDQQTCVNADGTVVPVKIGSKPVSGYCYEWTPSTGLSNANIANPDAAPTVTTIYTLTVVKENFSAQETYHVKVTVGELNNFTISQKYCCFKAGEKLAPSMFNITTDPPGFEDLVVFEPPVVPKSFINPEYNETIKAKAKCSASGTPIEYTMTIKVINEDVVLNGGLGIPNIPEFNYNAIKEKIEKAEAVAKGLSPPGAPCKFTHGLEANFSYSGMCCPEHATCPKDKWKITLSYKPCYGCKKDIILYGIPYVASFNFRFQMSACFVISGLYQTRCDDGQVCLSGSGELNLGGGISGTVLGGAALDASLMAVAKVTTPAIQVCAPKNETTITGKWCGQLDIVGEIVLISLIREKVTFTLISKRCL